MQCGTNVFVYVVVIVAKGKLCLVSLFIYHCLNVHKHNSATFHQAHHLLYLLQVEVTVQGEEEHFEVVWSCGEDGQ